MKIALIFVFSEATFRTFFQKFSGIFQAKTAASQRYLTGFAHGEHFQLWRSLLQTYEIRRLVWFTKS